MQSREVVLDVCRHDVVIYCRQLPNQYEQFEYRIVMVP